VKKLLLVFSYFIAGIYIITVLYNVIPKTEPISPYDYNICEEEILESDSSRQVSRSWFDYNYKNYCLDYEILVTDYKSSKRSREFIPPLTKNGTEYRPLGEIYELLVSYDKDKLVPLVDSLSHLRAKKQLNRDEFANLVVSMVQDIEYVLVLDREKCRNNSDAKLCVQGVKYGLHAPLEFLYTLQGDCDTRTVFLYALLKELGYNPKIVNSNIYWHSMLLLDISTTGDYLDYQGQKYYFWETTNKGWQPGMMPPEYNNKSFWHFALH
jgi:hypothetical protein